ncbi:hypothetical protein [Paraburkholderia adhaesiva]|nr:hypothetical protein [Paraburkholderia adhaesiva]
MRQFQTAAAQPAAAPVEVLCGLRFDDECDSTHEDLAGCPLGLAWSDVLY